MNKTIFLAIVAISILGCAGSPMQTGWKAEENRNSMLKLNINMSKEQVLETMGNPRKTEAYLIEKRNIEFWFYLTEGLTVGNKAGGIKDEHLTPLSFENGKLIGWGRNFYDRTLKYKHTIEVK